MTILHGTVLNFIACSSQNFATRASRARMDGRSDACGRTRARDVDGQASELASTNQSCASHTGACSSYWWLYIVVYMSAEEETTSGDVQMRSASTVVLSLSRWCRSDRAPAGRLLEQLLIEITAVNALCKCKSPLAVSPSFCMYIASSSHQKLLRVSVCDVQML